MRYTGRDHDVLRYACHRGGLDNGEPRCIAFGGLRVDDAIGAEVLRVVEPCALEAAILASRDEVRRRDEVLEALQRDLEAARYAANRARKQYDASDPENRLVAAELEQRWNRALEFVQALDERIERHRDQAPQKAPAQPEDFEALAEDLEALWQDPGADVGLRKRIVRTLIREVVADVEAGEIVLVVHWVGGVHTELHRPRQPLGLRARDIA